MASFERQTCVFLEEARGQTGKWQVGGDKKVRAEIGTNPRNAIIGLRFSLFSISTVYFFSWKGIYILTF
jgi:hypothetical protein